MCRRVPSVAIVLMAMMGGVGLRADTTALIDAVKTGNRAEVRALIAKSADVTATEPDGTTALHWAVRADDLETARLLVRAGANAKAANRYAVVPLALAVKNGNAAMTELLIEAGADPNATLLEGQTMLMTAARTGNVPTIKTLLAHGASPNTRESWYGQTALMWAAAQNHAGAVQALIEAGAEINGRSAQLPEAKQDPGNLGSTSEDGGFTPLLFAARQGALAAARALADAGADLSLTAPEGSPPMTVALLSGHYDVAALLLEKGADPNAVDRVGRGPLFITTDMNTFEYRMNWSPKPSGRYSPVDLAKMLIAKGANVNAKTTGRAGNPNLTTGSTAFMKAATTSDVEMMRLLLDNGADPFLTNEVKTNALMMVAGLGWRVTPMRGLARQELSIEAATILLERGFDINAANDAGETALHGAAMRTDERDWNQFIEFLVARGANLYTKTKQGRTPLDVARGGALTTANGQAEPSPPNPRTVALLEALIRQHPEQAKAAQAQ